jgi:serine/threonine protein kinase
LEATASAPRIVGRYVLYGEIASGGMATVHFGRLIGAAGFARPVAIKRLHAQFARDPDFVKMFLDEARLAARIAHPNVVPTLDVVAVEEEVFLVMEYVRGATLAHLARTVRHRGERIQPLISLGIVSGMLQGLHAAHEAKNDMGERLDLVHRDVSPQNALVGADGVTRVLDFGIAKASGRLQTTRDGQLKGKLAYMAPEQVRGEPLTRRTDVYATSVVLWEALTGKRLFYANNEANVLAKVLSFEVPAPSSIAIGLPQSLDRVVLRGLERDPERRYGTAREMAAEIDACIGVASPTEIGDWVERVAGEELRERALRIASIERSAAEAADDLRKMEATDMPTPAGKLAGEPTTYVWGQTTRNERKRRGEPSGISISSSRLAIVPTRAMRKLALATAGVALVLAVVVSVPRFLQNRTEHALTVRVSPVPALERPAPPTSIGSASAGVVPTINVEDLATEDAAPSAASALPAAKPARGTGPPVGSLPGPAEADCNPPYTADAKGHIHFKPNCI